MFREIDFYLMIFVLGKIFSIEHFLNQFIFLIKSFIFFSWFKESHHHLLDPLSNDPKIQHIGAAILINPVVPEDAGNYR